MAQIPLQIFFLLSLKTEGSKSEDGWKNHGIIFIGLLQTIYS